VIQGGVTIRKALSYASIASSVEWAAGDWGGESSSPPTSSGVNSVNLSWATLAYLGSGDVRVDITYQTKETRGLNYDEWGNAYYDSTYGGSAPVERSESQIFAGHLANTGANLTWTGDVADLTAGKTGISAVSRVVVYKRDVYGNWIKVVDRQPAAGTPFGEYGSQIEIGSPVDPSTAVTFKYRLSGTTTWTTPTLSKLGDSHWFDASMLSGTYEYEVWLTPKDGTAEKTESGTFTTKTDDSDDAAKTSNWERPVIKYTRDRWGNALSQTDPRNAGWKTVYTYNRDNQVTSEKKPDPSNGDQNTNSPTRNIYYDRLGRQRAVQDERGYVNVTEWDSGGNLTREIHADAGKVTYFYDAFGQKVRMVDAIGNTGTQTSSVYTMHTTRYAFDRLGRQTSTTHGNTSFGAVTNWHVDGNLELIMDGRQDVQETFTYDEAGRKLSQTNGANEKTRYWYDRAGNLVKTQLPGGQSNSATFDAYGHKLTETDANGSTSTWEYSYFGQLQDHTDIGGAAYTYLYDKAGQLTNQTNTRFQNLTYGYDAAGQLLKVTDATLGQTTTNAYDMAGRHVREKVVVNGEMFQDNHLSYDILGRLIDSADDRAHLTFQYDAAGNRTRITTHVRVAAVGDDDVETIKDGTRYFVYDKMNRQVVVDGIDSNGNISADQGHILTYDVNGNRLTDTFWGNKVTSTTPIYYHWDEDGNSYSYTGNPVYTKSSGYVTETYGYDGYSRLLSTDRDGTIVDQRWYDKAGRVVQSGVYNLPTGYTDKLNEGVADADQIGMELRRQIYDVNGRMSFQRAFRSDGTIKYDIAYQGVDRNGAALGYDAAGNVKAYEFRNAYGGAYKNTSTITLAKFEGYVEQKTVTTTTKSNTGTGTSTSSYDANGFLIGVDDATEYTLDKTITNDAAGRVLRVYQNGNKLYNSIVNGEVLGKFGVGPNELDPRTNKNQANFQQVAEFDFGYRSITGSYPAPSVGSYTVRQGDSLQGIAQAAFGDSSQWWRIAQANGLQSDRDLRVGQTLTLPSAVAGATNNSSTFKPYNPSDVVGDTSPNLPQPKNKGCGGLGAIIMVVVAVVVTIYTAGAAAAYLGPMMSGAFATVGGVGLSAAGAMTVGAIAGAAGSLASQLVGVAMGQTKFSWKQVAQSSISGAVTAGVGGLGNAVGSEVLSNVVVKAAVSNALTQGIGVATGLQKSFSWTGVAAAAAGSMMSAGVSAASSDALSNSGLDSTTQKLVAGTLAGIAGSATVSMMRGGRVNMQQIAADAFGNALGSSIADAMSSPDQTGANARSDLNKFNHENDRDYDTGTSVLARAIANSNGQTEAELDRPLTAEMNDLLHDAGFENDLTPTGGDLKLGRGKLSVQQKGRTAYLSDDLSSLSNSELLAQAKELLARSSAETRSPVVGGGLKLETGFPFPAEELPEGGFFRGLLIGQSDRSVLDPKPDWTENVGAGLHGLLASPYNSVTGLLGEVGSEYSDMYNLLTRSRADFTPSSALLNSLERNGMGGTLWNMTDGVFSAPSKPIIDLLDGNYERAGAGLPATFAAGMGLVNKLSALRLGETAGPDLIDFNNVGEVAPGLYRADPKQLRFMQPTVSPNYSEGGYTVTSTADDLRAGRITPEQLGDPLRVVMIDGKPFSFDNRRLLSYSLADMSDVPIQVMGLDDPVFAAKVDKRFNPIRNEGLQVVVVPSAERGATTSELYQLGLVRKKR
jgi:YD repeat-containing protein